MARRRTLNLLAATMLGTMDSNALVPVIALYAQHVGAALVTIGIIVGLFSAVHAPANLFFGRIADSLWSQAAASGGAPLGFCLPVPLLACHDAAHPSTGAGQPRHRERTRRSEFDGPHGGYVHERAKRPGDGPLRDVARPRGGDRLRHCRSHRRSTRVLDSVLRPLRGSPGGPRPRPSPFGNPPTSPRGEG